MALAMKKRHGGVPVKAYDEGDVYHVVINANESGSGIAHQSEAVVSQFSRTSDGVYVLTLGPRWKRVVVDGAPNVRKDGDWSATAIPVEGNQTNTVTVRTRLAGTLDDPDTPVDVSLYLVLERFNGTNG